MRRRQRRRDGFQGYSAAAAAAWDRVFGQEGSPPAPTEESPAENSHKSESPLLDWIEDNMPRGVKVTDYPKDRHGRHVLPLRRSRPCDKGKPCYCTGECRA